MEYPSANDFYLKLRALYNEKGNFIDYELLYISENFYKISQLQHRIEAGEKFSKLITDDYDIFGLKEVFLRAIPKSSSKFEIFSEDLSRRYLISIISEKENMIIFYNDISYISRLSKNNFAQKNLNNNILDFNDAERMLYFKDKLSGLYNRDFIEEEIGRLDTKRQLPISIISGDINGLKLINDAFGHSMGDKVIKKAAEIMKKHFRKEDIISRVGGDEFLIILPKTPLKIAEEIVDRIKRSKGNQILDFIEVSISFGVAAKEREEEDIINVQRKAEQNMYFKKLTESKESKLAIINNIKNKLEDITCETKSHYQRLKELCLMMSEKMCLSDIEKEELSLLCEFHDVGKVAIPKEILQKKDKLNQEEWEDVKRHSEIGYNIVKEFRDTIAIDQFILVHHERWDGKGYPGLLKDEQIPVIVRIFAIADAYDSMVNEKPYKSRMTKAQALKEIQDKAGSQFDPNIAKLFVALMEREKQIG